MIDTILSGTGIGISLLQWLQSTRESRSKQTYDEFRAWAEDKHTKQVLDKFNEHAGFFEKAIEDINVAVLESVAIHGARHAKHMQISDNCCGLQISRFPNQEKQLGPCRNAGRLVLAFTQLGFPLRFDAFGFRFCGFSGRPLLALVGHGIIVKHD